MKIINVGIIGMGFVGVLHYQALLALPFIKIRAVCVSRPEKIDVVREQYPAEIITDDWKEIVDNPAIDAIHNCTPNHLHDDINIAAVKAGKHIYSEKPLSLTVGSAYRIWKMAEEAGVAHGINHLYRFHPAVMEMKKQIQAGLAGRLFYIRGCYLQDSLTCRWDYSKRRIPETSMARTVLDIGIHWADIASFVLSSPVESVYAKMYIHYPVRIDPLTGEEVEIHSDDTTSVLVRFANGIEGQALFSKCMAGHKNDLTVTVSGAEREYSWEQQRCDLLYIRNRETGTAAEYISRENCSDEVKPYITLPPGHTLGWKDALVNVLHTFYQTVKDGSYKKDKMEYATFADGWRGNCFVDACLKSSEEDRWVSLKEEQK